MISVKAYFHEEVVVLLNYFKHSDLQSSWPAIPCVAVYVYINYQSVVYINHFSAYLGLQPKNAAVTIWKLYLNYSQYWTIKSKQFYLNHFDSVTKTVNLKRSIY